MPTRGNLVLFPGIRAKRAMAQQFLKDNLLEDILAIDILGSKGCKFAMTRCNLLLEVRDRMFTEDDLVLQVQRFQPEGFGADLFLADLLTIPQQECINERDLLIWDVCQTIPPTGQLVWILNAMEVNTVRGNWDLAFLADSQTSWIIAPNPVLDQKPLRCLELFAGAYGGWKGALEVLSKQGDRN